MADAVLQPWQWDLGGVVMGPGTPVTFAEVTGLGWAGVRDNDIDQPGMDGSFAGPDYFGTRTVEFDGAITAPGDPDACLAVLAALQASAANPAVRLTAGTTMPLRHRPPGSTVTKRLNGRLRRLEPELAALVHGRISLDMAFAATDPTWYGDTQETTEIPLGWLIGGGFTAPVQAPILVTNSAIGTDRPGWVTNDGDRDTWPVLRITGPCSNVTILHAETGRTLALPTLTLTASQWVELDARPGRRTVLRENGGNAEALLSAASRLDLFSLPPGQTEMRWTATDPTTTSRLRVTWRAAYNAL